MHELTFGRELPIGIECSAIQFMEQSENSWRSLFMMQRINSSNNNLNI